MHHSQVTLSLLDDSFFIKEQNGFEGTQNPILQVLKGPEILGFYKDLKPKEQCFQNIQHRKSTTQPQPNH